MSNYRYQFSDVCEMALCTFISIYNSKEYMKNNIFIQDGTFIHVLRPSRIAARIFSQEQRNAIYRLIRHNFFPHHTAVGDGICSRRHWALEKYRGRHGVGFKLITSSPFSTNFNHITYFIKLL